MQEIGDYIVERKVGKHNKLQCKSIRVDKNAVAFLDELDHNQWRETEVSVSKYIYKIKLYQDATSLNLYNL